MDVEGRLPKQEKSNSSCMFNQGQEKSYQHTPLPAPCCRKEPYWQIRGLLLSASPISALRPWSGDQIRDESKLIELETYVDLSL